jgi:TonB family protein
MKSALVVIVVFALLTSGRSQGSSDYYIASLQMPCYPPLARQAKVEGIVKVRIEVGNDGSVTRAEALEGSAILQSASMPNIRTWKFSAGAGEDVSRLKTTVAFEYRLEGEPGWEKCATRVIFDSFNHVSIIGHPPLPLTSDGTSKPH